MDLVSYAISHLQRRYGQRVLTGSARRWRWCSARDAFLGYQVVHQSVFRLPPLTDVHRIGHQRTREQWFPSRESLCFLCLGCSGLHLSSILLPGASSAISAPAMASRFWCFVGKMLQRGEEEGWKDATKCLTLFSPPLDYYQEHDVPMYHRWLLPCLPALTSYVQDTSGVWVKGRMIQFDCCY
jgi:hypothetical protein